MSIQPPAWLARLQPGLGAVAVTWPAQTGAGRSPDGKTPPGIKETGATLSGPPAPSPSQRRWSAVLALFSADDDPALVFTVRDPHLSHHPGQISFPGGGREAGDRNPAATALREANEEVGFDAAQAHIVGQLDDDAHQAHALPVGQNLVVPVVAWAADIDELTVHDFAEVAAVRRWRVSQLASPEHRVMAEHPRGGAGPAWQLGDDFLWGFTARLVDTLLRLGGWEEPWNTNRLVPIPPQFR